LKLTEGGGVEVKLLGKTDLSRQIFHYFKPGANR